jgi:hypothetical protein
LVQQSLSPLQLPLVLQVGAGVWQVPLMHESVPQHTTEGPQASLALAQGGRHSWLWQVRPEQQSPSVEQLPKSCAHDLPGAQVSPTVGNAWQVYPVQQSLSLRQLLTQASAAMRQKPLLHWSCPQQSVSARHWLP